MFRPGPAGRRFSAKFADKSNWRREVTGRSVERGGGRLFGRGFFDDGQICRDLEIDEQLNLIFDLEEADNQNGG